MGGRALPTDTHEQSHAPERTAPVNRFRRPSTPLPEGPPPEVLEEIDAAWERAQALFERGFDLTFEVGRGAGRGGYSAIEFLALACGESVEALLDGPAGIRLAA